MFGSVHLKTAFSGLHGYSATPLLDYTKSGGVLDRLISECNAVGIFTPEQMDSFEDPTFVVKNTDLMIIKSLLTFCDSDEPLMELLHEMMGKHNDKEIITLLLEPSKMQYDDLIQNMPGNMDMILQLLLGGIQSMILGSEHSIITKVVAAGDVFHKRNSRLLTQPMITPEHWNTLGYTQIQQRVPLATTLSDADVKISWGTNYIGHSLLGIATHHIVGNPTSILMFHGTLLKHRQSIQTIDWTKGGGALGQGFYLTLHPSEALAYGCRAIKKTTSYAFGDTTFILLLECIVKRANELIIGTHVTRNPQYGYENQIVGRNELVNNVDVVRIHVINADDLIVAHHALSNPSFIAYDLNDGTTMRKSAPCRTYHKLIS